MSESDLCKIAMLLKADTYRWRVLRLVETLKLPEGCIGAGFVRNLVWDHKHRRTSDCREEDVDVLFFDRSKTDAAYDEELEARLRLNAPELKWSVKNQARMHVRNGDHPYASVADAMRYWPETATAIAVAREGEDCILTTPFGTADLMNMILRPTSKDPRKRSAFDERIRQKRWLCRWPGVRLKAVD